MRRLSSVFLLLGGLMLLASFYLPWWRLASDDAGVTSYFGGEPGQTAGLPNLFSGNSEHPIDGWLASASIAAALLVVALAAQASVIIVRPALAPRLPVGSTGLA